MFSSLDSIIQSSSFPSILSFSSCSPSSSFLSKKSLKKLNGLISNAPPLPSYLYGLAYSIFLSDLNFSNYDESLFSIETINILFILVQNLRGTRLSTKLANFLLQIVSIYNSKNQNYFVENYEALQTIAQEKNLFVLSKMVLEIEENPDFRTVIELAKTEKKKALAEYQEFINRCATLQEQMIIMTDKSHEFFNNLLNMGDKEGVFENSSSKIEFLLDLTKFLDSVVYDYYYLLEFEKGSIENEGFRVFPGEGKEGKNEAKILVEYQYEFLNEIVMESPNYLSTVLPIADFIVNSIFEIEDDENYIHPEIEKQKTEIFTLMLKILSRLFFNFSIENKRVLDNLHTIFAELDKSLNFYLNAKDEASSFLSQLSYKNEKEILDSFSKYSTILLPSSPLSLPLSDLTIKSGFPMNTIIPAGSTFSYYIDVWLPNSIIHIAFAAKYYDIDFSIVFLGDFEDNNNEENKENKPKSQELLLLKYEKLKFDENAFRCSILAKKTGLYAIYFDNSRSWFNEKNIRYRVFILENPDFPVKYSFDFSKHAKNSQSIGKYQKLKPNPFFMTPYRLGLQVMEGNLHIFAWKNNKTYEITMEGEESRGSVEKIGEKVVTALKKTFQNNIEEFFKEKVLSISYFDNPLLGRLKEADVFGGLGVRVVEKLISQKEMAIEKLRRINFLSESSLIVFVVDDELFVLNGGRISLDFSNTSFNFPKNINFKEAYAIQKENRAEIVWGCVLNGLIASDWQFEKIVIEEKILEDEVKYIEINGSIKNLFEEFLKKRKNEKLLDKFEKLEILQIKNLDTKMEELISI